MGNRLATNCVEISKDPADLSKPGFWVVVNTFEGDWFCARFTDVQDAPLPISPWAGIDGKWHSSQSQTSYEANVHQIKELIAKGEIYQVNLCRVLSNDCDQSLLGLANLLQKSNPAPYFGAICQPGSIDVPRLLASESHPGLFHLVSDITGVLKSNQSWQEILTSLLPAGSISGAPKSSAIKVISQIEKSERGPYCGVIGWIENNQALLSVGIRIFWSKQDGQINFGTGAGITWQSDPNSEWEETELKAKRLISIADGVKV